MGSEGQSKVAEGSGRAGADRGWVIVHIPAPLRGYCGGASELELRSATVAQVLGELGHRYPGLYSGVCDETGRVRRHVNIFVNDAHIRDREGLDTSLGIGDVVTILPAVSGGST